ncbi:MAG: xanthine dehydrogenase family protein molybdopterin-binding subunit, partial [Phyllobacterium sp.]
MPGGKPDPLIERRVTIGQQTSRLDGPAKVGGRARFAAEIAMERLSFGALLHSPITRGRITRLDTSAAEAAPGVVLVMTYRNMPRLGMVPMIGGTNLAAAGNSALPVMQDPDIRYNGQVVAMVLAQTQEQAEHAVSLIEIEYQTETANTRFENAKPDARVTPSVLFEKNHISVGNAERELKQAAFKVDNVYRTPGHNHNAIELHAVTVAWDGDTVLLHDATQAIAATAGAIAKLFDLKSEQVRVLSPLVGGGFGGKAFWDHQIIAVAAARLAGRPVRLMLSREGVYRMIGGRSPSEQRVAVGADAEGKFTSIIHTGYSVMPPYAACPEPYTLGTRAIYQSRSFEIIQRYLDLDIVPNTFMRAPGEAIGTFALESAVDELA